MSFTGPPTQATAELEFHHPPTTAEFLFKALYCIPPEHRRLLCKISACQIAADETEQTLKWLKPENGGGKFHFWEAQ